ncbi:uncharacterized protein LOC106766701 isoform X2 [Vigna radiata var. radiata]|uniref:Uncharacterized protein LOC106766701 isoform X2 n=1 Tax=Vigna radiata var. radiata TaxID=3916 RepID=A0A1S3ULH3_VIGRR|nr:uncharacterized protein LOC106766701 isoform X2 [Vigna radiata var. radiata]
MYWNLLLCWMDWDENYMNVCTKISMALFVDIIRLLPRLGRANYGNSAIGGEVLTDCLMKSLESKVNWKLCLFCKARIRHCPTYENENPAYGDPTLVLPAAATHRDPGICGLIEVSRRGSLAHCYCSNCPCRVRCRTDRQGKLVWAKTRTARLYHQARRLQE